MDHTASLSVILHLPGQSETGFSRPDPDRPELEHTRAGLALGMERVIFETLRQRRRGALLVGETGSGKSTFMGDILRGRHVPEGLEPVRIDVRNDADPSRIDDLAGGCAPRLFVIDGLDRVKEPGGRRRLVEAIRAAAERLDADRWLVASRHHACAGTAFGARFAEFHLRPLDDLARDELARAILGTTGACPEEFIRALGRQPRGNRECAFVPGYPGQLDILCRAWVARREIASTRASLVEVARGLGVEERVVEGLLEWELLGDTASPGGPWSPAAHVVEPRSGVAFVGIPGGSFVMGSRDDDEGRWNDEGPRHEVQVPPFECAVTPVTNAQYARFLAANPGARVPAYWGDSRFNRDHQPVVGVWRSDAHAFAAWAGARLPSEAEWEYACRAATDAPRHGPLDDIAWWMGNSDGILHAVATRTPNAFGLHDMIGNVWEYVEDDRHDSYVGAPSDGGAWIDEPRGAICVLRGGSWADAPRVVRCTTRLTHHPGPRVGNVGFRIARTI